MEHYDIVCFIRFIVASSILPRDDLLLSQQTIVMEMETLRERWLIVHRKYFDSVGGT